MRFKIISAFCLVLFITISATSFSENKGASMLQGKPFFSVRVDISGCRYEVRMNDVPFLENADGLPVTVNFPVNEYLKKGSNELSLYLMPLFDDEEYPYNETKGDIAQSCNATASLQVRQSKTPDANNKVINTIKFNGAQTDKELVINGSTEQSKLDSQTFIASENGDIQIESLALEYWDLHKNTDINFIPPKYFNVDKRDRIPTEKGVRITQIINLESSLPEWEWLNSDVITSNKETKQELYQEFLKIQNLILSKKISKDFLYPHFEERTKELAQAYYTSENEMVPDGIIECAIDTKKFEFIEMDPIFDNEDNVFLSTYGKNKLATLTVWDNEPKIGFNETSEHGGSRTFQIYFRKENGKWIIAR